MWIEDESVIEDVELVVEEALAGIEMAAEKLRWALSQCKGVEYHHAFIMPPLEGNEGGPGWVGNDFAVDLVRKLLVEVKQQRCGMEAEENNIEELKC